jgi:thiamine biosynthesis lipoprotein
VALGGDIATAGPAPERPWTVHVTDDHRSGPDAPGQTVTIATGALATSSIMTRRRQADGQTITHIIDPATGAPPSGPWRTVSVAARSCVDANIASTAAIVLGHRAVVQLESWGLAARLIADGGQVVTTGDWPAEVHS